MATELGYETRQIVQHCQRKKWQVELIDPFKTTYGVFENTAFAEFLSLDSVVHDVSELDVLLVRRTRSAIEQILDFADFAVRANQNLVVVDPIKSFGRPTSKVESILRRSGYFNQPSTQVYTSRFRFKDGINFPVITKPSHGSSGRDVKSCSSVEELNAALAQSSKDDPFFGYGLLVQEELKTTEEYRVVVVGGKALGCIAKPKPLEGVARNAHLGNEFVNYEGSNFDEVIDFAEKASNFHEQNISGVDIIEANGRLYLLECNRNPQFEAFDFATGHRTARSIVEFLESQTKNLVKEEDKHVEPLTPNTTERPRVFVGSSTEGITVAENIQLGLDQVSEVVLWNQGTFEPSVTGFECLKRMVNEYDFAIFCLTPDDSVEYRHKSIYQPRDNVLFEVGLFMGVLGPERVMLVVSIDDKIKLPSDLDGITLINWKPHSSGDLRPALGKVITEISYRMGLR